MKPVMNKLNNAFRVSLLASSIVFASSGIAAEEQAEESDATKAERIEVTGSRIKRSDLESADPVIIISNEEMQRKGYVTVFDALKNLSQNSGTTQGAEFSSGFTPDVQTLNLRNVGVGYTLTLINGRRLANYPAAYNAESSVVNYGAIPAAAVERVEILTNGASAIYGSDAVAGVINIILRKDIDESTINVLLGRTDEGGKSEERLQFLTGKTWDSGNITLGIEYQNRDGIYAKDYDNYDSWYDYPYGQGFVDRAILELGAHPAFPPTGYRDVTQEMCDNAQNGSVISFRPGSGYYCGIDFAGDRPLRNPREHYSLYLSATQEVGDIEFFTDILYYNSESSSARPYLFVSEYIYPESQDDLFLAQRLFTERELGRELDTQFEDTSYSFALGANGVFGDNHDWEFLINRSVYTYDVARPWFKSEKVIEHLLGDYWGFWGSDGPWTGTGTFGLATNLFNPLPASVANDLVGTQTYGNETYSNLAQFVVSGDLFEIDGRPAGYAVVVEYEKSGFEFKPDERIQQAPPIDGLFSTGWWGLTGFYGEGDRKRTALGVEFSLPLLESLTMNVAARLDDYDSVTSATGGDVTPQVSLQWRPMDGFLVRASFGHSFRAPDMNYVFTNTGFFTSITDYQNCLVEYVEGGGDPASFDLNACGDWDQGIYALRSGTANIEGAEPLKDETGTNFNVGFAWDITDDLFVSMDYFKLELEDQVVTESLDDYLNWEYQCYGVEQGYWDYSEFAGLSAERCAYVDARVTRTADPLDPAFTRLGTLKASPVNQAQYENESIDTRINYKLVAGPAVVQFAASWTHNLVSRSKTNANEPWYDYIADDWTPRHIGTGAVSVQYNEWDFAWTTQYRGSMAAYRPSQAATYKDERVDPYLFHNFTMGYAFSESTRVGLRVANILNDEPPKDPTMLATDHPWYNIFAYGGAGIGRQYYVDFEHTF